MILVFMIFPLEDHDCHGKQRRTNPHFARFLLPQIDLSTLLIGSVGCGAKMSVVVLVQMYAQGIVAQMEGRCQIGGARRSRRLLYRSIIATLRDRNGRETLASSHPRSCRSRLRNR